MRRLITAQPGGTNMMSIKADSSQACFALYGVVESLFLLSQSRMAFHKCHQQSWTFTNIHMSCSMPISAIHIFISV